MRKQFDPVALLLLIKQQVEQHTPYRCYDAVPVNAESPFFFLELVSANPANSKNTYITQFDVNVHVIAEKSPSSVPVLHMVQALEEALTDDIDIHDPYALVTQTETGIQSIQTDETGEKHAVVGLSVKIAYGYMCKI